MLLAKFNAVLRNCSGSGIYGPASFGQLEKLAAHTDFEGLENRYTEIAVALVR